MSFKEAPGKAMKTIRRRDGCSVETHNPVRYPVGVIAVLLAGLILLGGETATTQSLLEWESVAARIGAGGDFMIPSGYWGEGWETYLRVRNLDSAPAFVELSRGAASA